MDNLRLEVQVILQRVAAMSSEQTRLIFSVIREELSGQEILDLIRISSILKEDARIGGQHRMVI